MSNYDQPVAILTDPRYLSPIRLQAPAEGRNDRRLRMHHFARFSRWNSGSPDAL